MKTLLKSWMIRVVALLFLASAALAQDRVPFRQAELDQMLAPVALYPDSLLSQMLMASTYPLEVVQAARWSRANPGLKGQDAVRAVEGMDWDPSVKSLTAFPQVLSTMDEKIDWTERLGEAFLAQQADVMDTVQDLRRRAEAAGHLAPSDRMRVARQGDEIVILPPAPEVVYVPYYDPRVVYGAWWWPGYPPIYWAPPAYYVVPAHRPSFVWASGIVISAGFFFGHFDWPHRHVKVVHVHHSHHAPHPTHVHSTWRHDPVHRRGVPFRHADARQSFQRPTAAVPQDSRRDNVARSHRGPDDRTAEARQRRWDERRNAAPERREAVVNRAVPQKEGNRVAPNRDDNRARPAPRPETRTVLSNRSAEQERIAPQPRERKVEREEGPRPQAREVGPRPANTAPSHRTDSRPAAPRAENRPAPEARRHVESRPGNQPERAAPRQQAARESAPPARAATHTPSRAPRAEHPRHGNDNGVRARGNPPAIR